MAYSKLVNFVMMSPNMDAPRNHNIDTITIHHMAGNLSIERCGEIFHDLDRAASSNYGIGTDGRIACYVDETNRAWTSGSADNDNRAITIEVANDSGAEDWHVSDAAMDSLILLCADICKRNNIKELKWKNDPNLIGQVDLQNMTVHRWFQATACPGPYLMSKMGYIAEEVNKMLNGDVIYRVQIGAFKVKENAERQLQAAKDAGFEDAFITGVSVPIPETVPVTPIPTITVGSKVKIKEGANTYDDIELSAFVYENEYDVLEINNNRVVIGDREKGIILAAMRITDLYLV